MNNYSQNQLSYAFYLDGISIYAHLKHTHVLEVFS